MTNKKSLFLIIIFSIIIFSIKTTVYTDSEHKIVPGDKLQINVWGIDEDLNKEVSVREDGEIFLPWVGRIIAAGLTYSELEKVIQEKLSEYFKNFGVLVGPAEVKLFFSILGEVKSPGTYEMIKGMTVSQAIAQAGGLTENASSEVKVLRENKEIIDIDLNKIFKDNLIEKNIALIPSDIIYVPKQSINLTNIYILGQISKPGQYELPLNSGVEEAIVIAGGFITSGSVSAGGSVFLASSKPGIFEVTIRRNGKKIETLLLEPQTLIVKESKNEKGEVNKNNNSESTFVLKNNDVIFVKEIKYPVIVLGEVIRPGIYEFKEGDKVSDAIALTGGFGNNPHLKEIGVIRWVDGTPTLIKVNMEEVLRKGKLNLDIELKDKDIIFVPNRTKKITLETIFTKISTIYTPLFAGNVIKGVFK